MILRIPVALSVAPLWFTLFNHPSATQAENPASISRKALFFDLCNPPEERVVEWRQLGDSFYGENSTPLFGFAVAMSANGNRIAIGSIVIDGGEAVRVYEWNGSAWLQMGGDIEGYDGGRPFGTEIAMSANGLRVAISGANAYKIRVYDWTGSAWDQVGNDVSGKSGGHFGTKLGLSADGTRLVGKGYLIGGGFGLLLPIDHYIWTYNFDPDTTDWVQSGLDIDGDVEFDLSGNGNHLAVEDNGGVGGVRVYGWSGTDWQQVGGNIEASSSTYSLSSNGLRVAVGLRVFEYNSDMAEWVQLGADVGGLETLGSRWTSELTSDGNRLFVNLAKIDGTDGTNIQAYDWDGTSWNQVGPELLSLGRYSSDSIAATSDGTRVVIGTSSANSTNGDIDAGHVAVYEAVVAIV